jgi:hypothetical protein
MKTIILKPNQYLSDKEIDKKEGHYFDKNYYKKKITDDADVFYLDEKGEKKLLLKFRKDVIPQKYCKQTFQALYGMARKKNRNRGAAAGIVKTKKLPNYVGRIKTKHKFRVFYKDKKGKLTKDNIGNTALSNIMGYYDRPDRNFYRTKKAGKPEMCRVTAFTRDYKDKWNKTVQLIQQVDKQFKRLLPERHKLQLKQASQTPKFQIKNTAFSTVTTNYNWRTASHKDSGDFEDGFGNLIVLEKDKCGYKCPPFKGGLLGFPKFKVCVDIRQGDFLAMDVHQWHGNTRLYVDDKGEFEEEPGRLSLVCYLRKKMIKCKK